MLGPRNREPLPDRSGDVRSAWILGRPDVTALLCASLTAMLGAHRLGARSIWLDEAVSLRIAETPGTAVLMSDGGNMAFYYLVLRLWPGTGDALWQARLPSVFFASAAVGLFVLLVRRLFGAEEALIAGLLLALNSSVIYYAQEARGYALILLLAVACWFALALALQERRAGWFLAWGLLGALGMGSHLFFAFILVAQMLSLGLIRVRELPARGVVAGLGLAAAGSVPFLAAALIRGGVQIDWIPPASATAIRQIALFLAGNNFEPSPQALPTLIALAVLAIGAVGWSAGAGIALRTVGRQGRGGTAWAHGMAVLWLLVPLAGAVLVSLALRPLLVPRYFIVSVPAGCLLLALALTRIPRTAIRYAVAAALLAISASGVYRSYDTGEWGWRAAAGYLSLHARPADAVVVLPSYQRLSLDHHLDALPGAPTLDFISPSRPGWRPPDHTVFGVAESFHDPAPADQAAFRAREHLRFWVVTSDFVHWNAQGRVEGGLDQAATFFEALGDGHRVRRGEAFHRVGVLLMEQVPEPADGGGRR